MKVKPLLLFCILCTFCACRENSQMSQRFLEIDELTNSHPDSALAILDTMRTAVSTCSRAVRMKYELLYAKAQNRAYVDFTTDSVMLEVCDYYDHHAPPNERMLAHYLLGCTYRDMGEAPRTLECYKDAVACADTLSPDCDYRTMMSICGQMASLYDKQIMPIEELSALNQYGISALKCSDTLCYIQSIELQMKAYNLLNDTTHIYEITKEVHRRYMEVGATERAAKALLVAIHNRLFNNQLLEAKAMMDEFEAHSGLFNANGEIESRWTNYYICKGMYYHAISRPDSAENFYRLLLGSSLERDACKGLLRLYSDCGQVDSVTKYLNLYEEAEDKYITDINFKSVRQTEAMYDYTRNQRIAHEESIKRESRERQLMLLGVVSILATVSAIYLFRWNKQKKLQEVRRMTDEYLTLSAQYENNRKELELSRKNFAEYESQKSHEQEMLNLRIQELQARFDGMNDTKKRSVLSSTSIVSTFRELTVPRPNMQHPTSRQWAQLSYAINHAVPDVYGAMSAAKLTEQEFRIAILTYLDFSVADIASLMESTSQRVSNAKRNANKKMFGMDESKSFAQNLHHMWRTEGNA